jgi:hypothetical protein
VDWNEDGMKDLITGENNGNIRIYLNTNTDEDPVFSGYALLEVGGVPFKSADNSYPAIVDWNNDGKKDLLSGEKSGKVVLLINKGTNADPIFNSVMYVKDGGAELSAGNTSSPTVVDWNRDGKKDLIVGENLGCLFYYENKGTDSDPVFKGYQLLSAEGQIIDVDLNSHPDSVDWDNDGVMDLLCGNSTMTPYFTGFVYLFHSLGPLSLSDNQIVEGTASSIDFTLDAGMANAGRNYIVLGSVTGTEPGYPLPGGHATLPLNWDPFTDLILIIMNSPILQNFLGKLDVNGRSTAQLNLPPLSGFAGTVLYFAYTLNSPFDYVSNAAAIEIIP